MSNVKLGLPLEYRKLSQYFDALNTHDDTEAKNLILKKLLEAHQVGSVLDFTCGTGSQVFFLAKGGYEVTGVDISPDLLQIAKEKALKEKMNIKFVEGDMRTSKIGKFDAVITIFNAVGHLTKNGFTKAIQNIYRNLKPGGIYIFDIFNLEAMTNSAIMNLAYQVYKKVGASSIYATQCSTIDRQKGILTSYDSYMVQKDAAKPERFNNKFSLQIYTAKELRALLIQNGFEVLQQTGIDSSKFITDKTITILTVARKI